jgi:hypothetical protein
MVQLAAGFTAEASFLEPEILKFEKGTTTRFIGNEPRLKKYAFYLADIDRRAAHTLSDKEEALLAMAGPLGGVPANVYGILSNADFPHPSVTLSDGKTVTLNQANFNAYRGVANRKDREAVMSAFFTSLASSAAPSARRSTARCRKSLSSPKPASTTRRLSTRSTDRTFPCRSTHGWSTASTRTCRRSTGISTCASA